MSKKLQRNTIAVVHVVVLEGVNHQNANEEIAQCLVNARKSVSQEKMTGTVHLTKLEKRKK